MEISIDEAIKQLTTYSIPCGKYKNAYDMAINIMRKYQKIEEIVGHYGYGFETSWLCLGKIGEVLEDRNDD